MIRVFVQEMPIAHYAYDVGNRLQTNW